MPFTIGQLARFGHALISAAKCSALDVRMVVEHVGVEVALAASLQLPLRSS